MRKLERVMWSSWRWIDDGFFGVNQECPDGGAQEHDARGNEKGDGPGADPEVVAKNQRSEGCGKCARHVHDPGDGAAELAAYVHGDGPGGANHEFQKEERCGQAHDGGGWAGCGGGGNQEYG